MLRENGNGPERPAARPTGVAAFGPRPSATASVAVVPGQSDASSVKSFSADTADGRYMQAPLAPAEAPDAERPTAELQRIVPQSAPQRADIARSVAQQMTTAVAQSPEGTIDVRLSPEELGRVRLALSPGDLGVTVLITAERPETLDLVRRHIDLFAQDLRQNGFQNLAFTFGQDTRRGTPAMPAPPETDNAVHSEAASSSAPQSRTLRATGRLDLRL